MSHNPHNNYSGGNKFHYERSRPAAEETLVISETESFEEVKVEEDVVQDATAVTEETDATQKDTHVVDQPEADGFVEEDSDVFAVVTNCRKLNIREAPNMDADIVTVFPAGSEVMIDIANSTDEFYKVCNAVGIEGYCMKQYIELRG